MPPKTKAQKLAKIKLDSYYSQEQLELNVISELVLLEGDISFFTELTSLVSETSPSFLENAIFRKLELFRQR